MCRTRSKEASLGSINLNSAEWAVRASKSRNVDKMGWKEKKAWKKEVVMMALVDEEDGVDVVRRRGLPGG
eukprot:5511077-Pyramimonas_sp.AAC.1